MEYPASLNHSHRLMSSTAGPREMPAAPPLPGWGKAARHRLLAATCVALVGEVCWPHGAQAAPVGGTVVAGSASVERSGATTVIRQGTPNLVLSWQQFNIAPQETVNFVQPSASAIAINRIADANGTQILGRLNANGQVYLINPNGVLFGSGAQVNVAGLVAATLDLSDAVLKDGARTFAGQGRGRVYNQGSINAAPGGYVALLGNSAGNDGVITAPLGTVALGGGSAVTLNFNGSHLIGVRVERSALHSLAENGGLLQADGGGVVLTAGAADSLLASAVNNSGVIEARTVRNQSGSITLLGGMVAGTVNLDGTLDVSAPVNGNGGMVDTSAAHVKVADGAVVKAAAALGASGSWRIDPADFIIAASGGDISGAALRGALNSADVTIASSGGHGGSGGDVVVNDVVNWSAHQLTLQAENNILFNANLNGTGTASLALEYGQNAPAAGNTSAYRLTPGVQVSLPAGQNFSTKLGSDGATINYTVVTSLGAQADATVSPTVETLQGLAGAGKRGGNYVLGGNVDASATAGWNSGAGFTPIGSNDVTGNDFAGIFDGLGHTIRGLTINTPASSMAVGLFGSSGDAIIRNVGLTAVHVTGSNGVGGLVGFGAGATHISNVAVAGSISGNGYVGGIVGDTENNAAISVDGSRVDVNVTGRTYVGGLMGVNYGTVNDSYASGSVSGSVQYTGGLLGGLGNTGKVSNSYSIASVGTAGSYVGGLVGFASGGVISNSYATGGVTGPASTAGGLVGGRTGATSISNSYWDSQSSGRTVGIASGSKVGATAMSFASQTQATYAGWDFGDTWAMYKGQSYPLLQSFMTPLVVTASGTSTVTYNGAAYADPSGVTYSSFGHAVTPTGGLLGTVGFSVNGVPALHAGTYTVTPDGLYSNQQGYLISYTGSKSVIIQPAPLTATADISGLTNKVYDGSTHVFGATVTGSISGAVPGDTLTLDTRGISLRYDSSHVVGATEIAARGTAGFTIASSAGGSLSGDYRFVPPVVAPVAGTITPAPLTATASLGGVSSKEYDGNTSAPGVSVSGAVSGAVGGDTLALDAAGIVMRYDRSETSASSIIATGALGFTISASPLGSVATDYAFTPPVIAPMAAVITQLPIIEPPTDSTPVSDPIPVLPLTPLTPATDPTPGLVPETPSSTTAPAASDASSLAQSVKARREGCGRSTNSLLSTTMIGLVYDDHLNHSDRGERLDEDDCAISTVAPIGTAGPLLLIRDGGVRLQRDN